MYQSHHKNVNILTDGSLELVKNIYQLCLLLVYFKIASNRVYPFQNPRRANTKVPMSNLLTQPQQPHQNPDFKNGGWTFKTPKSSRTRWERWDKYLFPMLRLYHEKFNIQNRCKIRWCHSSDLIIEGLDGVAPKNINSLAFTRNCQKLCLL